MITVNGPGGAVVTFPDGTDGATIDKVMTENFAASAEPQESLAGAGRAAFTGGIEGVASLLGLPADAANLASKGLDYVAGTKTNEKFGQSLDKYGYENIKKNIEGYTGKLYEPQTGLEKHIRTGFSFLPAAAVGPGGVARRVATQVVAPGLASEAAGQLTEGTGYEPVARVGAALAGTVGASKAASALTGARGIPKPPTNEQIHADTSPAYNTPALQAVRYDTKLANQAADDVIFNKLQKQRFSQKDPVVAQVYDQVENLRKPEFAINAHTIQDFETTRQRLQALAKQGGDGGQAANIALRTIETHLANPSKSLVIAGDAVQAAKDLRLARKIAQTGFQSDTVQNWLEMARNTAAATHSGTNLENELYKQIRNALNAHIRKATNDPLRGWTPKMLDQLRSVLPDYKSSALRRVGKLLGGGGGLGQLAAMAAGTHAFGPLGLLLPGLGMVANKAGSGLAVSRLNKLDEMVRSQAPSYAPYLTARQRALAGTSLSDLQNHLALQALIAARLQTPQGAGQ